MIFKTVNELTKEYELKSLGGCFCDGYNVIKFKGQYGLRLEYRNRVNTFRLFNMDKTFTNKWEKIIHLENKLKEAREYFQKKEIQNN